MTVPKSALKPSTWTLRAKLVASMLVLFTALSLVTGAVTLLSLRTFLTGQVDDQLRQSLQRIPLNGGPPQGSDSDPGRRRGPGNEGLTAVLGQNAGAGVARTRTNEAVNLNAAQLTLLQQAGASPQRAKEVDLGDDLGEYRIMARYFPNAGITSVVGLPVGPLNQTVQRMVVIGLATLASGFLLAASLGTWLVRRNLLPLQRVAGTAKAISEQPLHSGEVAVQRVPAEYTDPGTEVGQVGRALNSMIDNVEGALQSRQQSEMRVRQFVADASHELRTPLASIKGYAELSKREREPVPAGVTHAMGRIESEAGRMATLVEDLLLLARLDAGRPLERQTVDLSMLVINAVSDAHAASPEHRWTLDLPPEPVEVTGDSQRLHQVIANLLANARAHTPPGTVVTTSITREAGGIRLSVHDNGPGVPISLQANVFERFARGDDSRNRAAGSTGLGLSIVAAVTKAHSGSVELHSVPGDTTFSVLIPD